MPHVSHFSFISEGKMTKFNKASVTSSVIFHSIMLHPPPLPPPSYTSIFCGPTLKASQAPDKKIQMPSLKSSESKRHSQRREFATLRPNLLLLPWKHVYCVDAYGGVCVYVCVCVHGWKGTCKAWALQRTPRACQWCWQVAGSSSKGCPHSACLEALLWQEAWVIKGGQLRGDDGGW